MIKIENPSNEETKVVRVEVSKSENMTVAGIERSEIKSYRDENGNTMYYVEMEVPVSLKSAYEGDENAQKKREARAKRCLIPGKHKDIIRCPECNKCSECPYFEKKKAGIISLDQYVEDGCPEIPAQGTPEDEAIYFDMLDSLINVASEKRERLGQEVKLLCSGFDKKELSKAMNISETTVYEDLKIIKDLLTDIIAM